MVANFILSALAITAGIAYFPLKLDQSKWLFASSELFFLGLILLITWSGGRLRWHSRWFETRRVAEYLRHSPVMLLLGVARPAVRWPRGKDTNWPEYHARHSLRSLGLPRLAVTSQYLQQVLKGLLDDHVMGQRDYHVAKAKRLATVHHRLGVLSEGLFILAVITVAGYLVLNAAAATQVLSYDLPHKLSKLFTFLAVVFPTWAAAIAGIRFFGDFERFASISEITAEKLGGIHSRIRFLLDAPEEHIRYSAVAETAHAIDEVVVTEIENWQAVFGGKHITVPA